MNILNTKQGFFYIAPLKKHFFCNKLCAELVRTRQTRVSEQATRKKKTAMESRLEGYYVRIRIINRELFPYASRVVYARHQWQGRWRLQR